MMEISIKKVSSTFQSRNKNETFHIKEKIQSNYTIEISTKNRSTFHSSGKDLVSRMNNIPFKLTRKSFHA